MRTRGLRELLVAIAMLGGVSAAGVLVARDLGQAVQVIRTCEGRGEAAHCRESPKGERGSSGSVTAPHMR